MANTKKPLEDMIPDIMVHINNKFETNIDLAREQLNIYSGDVKTPVEESIRKEILSPKSLNVMLERIVPINLLKQTTDKMSQAYAANVKRTSDELDQGMVDYYINAIGLNSKLSFSNQMLNLHNYVGLEPYTDDSREPKMRILDASRYIPYSDDAANPNEPTVAIKWMHNVDKYTPFIDNRGKVVEGKESVRSVKVFYMYSNVEVLIVDADGEIRYDLMAEQGIEDGVHGLGILPIVHVNTSEFDLVPIQDTSKKDITVSVSKKLTDLSFATLYQSHSMFYGIDVEVSNLDSNPDAFLDIKSEEGQPGSNKSPQIGILQPKVNITETLELIEAEVSLHLKSLGLSIGSGAAGNNAAGVASGVAKMIDEAGAEELNRRQRMIYKHVEERGLWKLLGKLHNAWVSENKIDYPTAVSDDLKVNVEFSERKPSESETAVIERITKKLDAKLTSRRRAIQEANPDLNTEQIDELIKEIDEDNGNGLDNLVFPSEDTEE